jgi:hypothetical protein
MAVEATRQVGQRNECGLEECELVVQAPNDTQSNEKACGKPQAFFVFCFSVLG